MPHIPASAFRRVARFEDSEAYVQSPARAAFIERAKQQAPNRCEMCDHPLPTFEDREKHMAETRHCACPECQGYIPPGCVYAHWETLHGDLWWNDHYINAADKQTLMDAKPWVRDEFRRKFPYRSRDADAWFGPVEQASPEEKKEDKEDTGDAVKSSM